MDVVFPAPFRPSRPNALPLSALKETPVSTFFGPKDFSISFSSKKIGELKLKVSIPVLFCVITPSSRIFFNN
jgi:hypothetical protein